MTKIKEFNSASASKVTAELWFTRFGKSARVVKRHSNGQFVTNISSRQILSQRA